MRLRDFGDALFAALRATVFATTIIACFGLLLLTIIALMPQLGIFGYLIVGGVLALFLALLAYEISLRW